MPKKADSKKVENGAIYGMSYTEWAYILQSVSIFNF